MSKSNISQKKLKAIVFTDIVDFTKLSADDEQKALEVIDRQRELLKPIVLEHKGEWLKEIGDGLLFSFDSSLDAVNCSIKIQEVLKDIDDFKIRIGIHQGDIFVKDGDVYGDDVNIASRVEGFSPEGGITISDKVYKDIQGVKEIKTAFIGHKPLKGVNQETKVRCIISNNLPKNKGLLISKIIGYGNIYFGILLLLLLFGTLNSIFKGNDFMIVLDIPDKFIIIFFLLNVGLILILFGYSTLSYFRGVSIKSQKLIYYYGNIYLLINCSILIGSLIYMPYNDLMMSYIFFISLPLILILLIPYLYRSLNNKRSTS